MSLRSALGRLMVTIPFFAVSGILLGYFSNPITRSALDASDSAPVVVLTTPLLKPAFDALEVWNREQGCPTFVISLGETERPERLESRVAYIGALCGISGARGMLLGGDSRAMPVLASPVSVARSAAAGDTRFHFAPRVVPVLLMPGGIIPEGLRVSRAPVRDLAEAWQFVEDCRRSGQTLDELLRPLPSAETAMATGLSADFSAHGVLSRRHIEP